MWEKYAATLLGALLLVNPARAEVTRKGPYLADVRTDGVSIRVETEPATAVVLEVKSGPTVKTASDEARSFHSLRIDGLTSKTTYSYALTVGTSKHEGTFTTAPGDAAPFKVVVFGDDRTHGGMHQAVVRAIEQVPSDFLINTGDLVSEGDDEAQWQAFFDVERKLLASRCLFVAVGNHELAEENAVHWVRYFAPDSSQVTGKLYFTMRWGMARFYFINAMANLASGDDREWLDRELAKSEPDVKWRIAVMHQGPYASGIHGDNVDAIAAGIPELLVRAHVDLVLGGHDHLYERGAERGIHYVVSGGGGAPLYPIRRLRPSSRKGESAYHFIQLDVGADAIELVAQRIDGSIIERVQLTHTGWADAPDAPTAQAASATAPAPTSAPQTTAPVAASEDHTVTIVIVIASGAFLLILVARSLIPRMRETKKKRRRR